MRGVFQDEAGVGLAAEVDAGAVREAHPVGGVLHAGRWGGEKVAPVAGVGLGEERAVFAVRAGRDDAVGATELVAHGGEGAAVGVGAGLDPEHGGGAGGEAQQLGARLGGELVEHVADHEGEGLGRLGGGLDLEAGPGRAGAGGGEGDRLGAVVEEGEAGEMVGAEGVQDATPGDAGAAAEVHQRGRGGRAPGAEAEFGEEGVPLPADAFAVGGVVGGEGGGVLPIRAGRGGLAGEEDGAQAVEGIPVEGGEVGHGGSGERGVRKLPRRADTDALVRAEDEQIFVPGQDKVGGGAHGRGEDVVVVRIATDGNRPWRGFDQPGASAIHEEQGCLLGLEVELAAELIGQLRQQNRTGEPIVRERGPAKQIPAETGHEDGGQENVGVEHELHARGERVTRTV